MQFQSAPLVGSTPQRGVWAEGLAPDGDTLQTFELAVANYGFLLALNEQLTGQQWIERIRRAYDCSPGSRNDAVVQTIARCMLVDQFRGRPPAPATVAWPSEDLRQRAMAVIAGQAAQANQRQPQPYDEDAQAISWAMYALATEHGMVAFGTFGRPQGMAMRPGAAEQDPSPDSIEASLQMFVGDLAQCGRLPDPGRPIYLMKRAPLINPHALHSPGRVISAGVIGWAVPHAHVERACERALDAQSPSSTVETDRQHKPGRMRA